MAKIETLIRDIYRTLEDKETPDGVDTEAVSRKFGDECADILRGCLKEQSRNGRLRLSAIGRPDRKLFNDYHGLQGEPLKGPTYIKFLYGHVVEAILLALAELAGHEVRDNQKEVEVEGVKGHIDGYIDGVLMDVKSCSSFGFKKFKYNQLHEEDPFGYIAQLRSYAYAENQNTYGWLAMDKSSGELAWLQYYEPAPDGAKYKEALDWSVPERVKHVKKMVKDGIPSICYEPIPDGKSGNMQLASGCRFCEYKFDCFPELRVIRYSNGPRYLTKVVREPKPKGSHEDHPDF